jgi:hypothetical protein
MESEKKAERVPSLKKEGLSKAARDLLAWEVPVTREVPVTQ